MTERSGRSELAFVDGNPAEPSLGRLQIGFPFQLDDEQPEKAIAEMREPANWPGFEDFATLLPELKLALVASGLREQSRRKQASSAERRLMGIYAILAVSVVAVFLSGAYPVSRATA